MLTVAAGRTLEAWDTDGDGEHWLHADDVARLDYGIDVFAKLEARLTPVLGIRDQDQGLGIRLE